MSDSVACLNQSSEPETLRVHSQIPFEDTSKTDPLSIELTTREEKKIFSSSRGSNKEPGDINNKIIGSEIESERKNYEEATPKHTIKEVVYCKDSKEVLYEVYKAQNLNTAYQPPPSDIRKLISKKDIFGEKYEKQCERIKSNSPYGKLRTWRLEKIIVKKGCDLRQEQFAMQLISQFHQIFQNNKVDIWLKPYEIICTGPNCGLVECINDALSIDSLKHKLIKYNIQNLRDFFLFYYPTERQWRQARYNFARSMAGYSLISYILQLKDRHNGNLMLDREGHIIHIDFDFLISNSPGGNMKFEMAPFKLTQEFMDVLNGRKSKCFKLYKNLMVRGFMALQKEYRKILVLVEMMLSVNKNLPCFVGGPSIIPEMKFRLFPQVKGSSEDYTQLNATEASTFINLLISSSYGDFHTRAYDTIQYCFQGIF